MSWKETDPLTLWKTASIVPQPQKPVPEIGEKTDLTERFSGSRTKLWQSLFEMTPESRQRYLHKLVNIWPYQSERWAFRYPLGVQVTGSCFSQLYICAKVNADVFFLDKKMGFIESLKRCPKGPVVLTLCAGTIIPLLPQWHLVSKPLIEHEDRPDAMRVFMMTAAIAVVTGVVIPTVSTPYLSHYEFLRQHAKADPLARNYIDLITLSYELTRSIWRKIPLLIGVQVALSAACTYVTLWGRERIYGTIDVDPELIRSLMTDESHSHWIDKVVAGWETFYSKVFGLFGGAEMNEREAMYNDVEKILEGDRR